MRDALKNYLSLASGLTKVGRKRARAASKALVAQGEATADQIGNLAEDLVQTSKHNRELVTALVRSEVEKALGRVGPATADEVQRLTKRLQTLEAALRDAPRRATAGAAGAVRRAATTTAQTVAKPAKPAKAAKAPAKKPAARRATKPAAKAARKPAARKPAARKPAKKAGA